MLRFKALSVVSSRTLSVACRRHAACLGPEPGNACAALVLCKRQGCHSNMNRGIPSSS